MIFKLSKLLTGSAICAMLVISSCTKENSINVTETNNGGFYQKKSTKTTLSSLHPLNITVTVQGVKINVSWTRPNDFPSNAYNIVTSVKYEGSMGTNNTFYTLGSSHSFIGSPGETVVVTVKITYFTPGSAGQILTDDKEAYVASTAVPTSTDCETPTAQMSFPEEIEYADSFGGTLYKQDSQIIVRLPADYFANQSWIIRYRKNEANSIWQYSTPFPSSGTIIYGRSFNFHIFNGLDGEYVFELGVNCAGTPMHFTNTSYASTIVM